MDKGANGEQQSRDAANKEFLKEFVKKLEEDPKTLSATEKKLGERYLASKAQVGKLSERMKELDVALSRAKIEFDQEMGKSAGILEAVLALRD